MFTLPYFRLTDQEHSSLQKRLHQSSAYVFGNLRLVRELENLGRGWSAFVRAQEQAKKDGILPAFQLQLKAELDETVRMGTAYNKVLGAKQRLDEHDNPLPPSAVSMRAAETGSTQLLKQGEKRKGIKASELGQLDTGDNNGEEWGKSCGAMNWFKLTRYKEHLRVMNTEIQSHRPNAEVDPAVLRTRSTFLEPRLRKVSDPGDIRRDRITQ